MKPRPHRRPSVPYVSTIDVFDDAGDIRPLESIERDVIVLALARYDSVTRTARVLKISRSTLYRKKGARASGQKVATPEPKPGSTG